MTKDEHAFLERFVTLASNYGAEYDCRLELGAPTKLDRRELLFAGGDEELMVVGSVGVTGVPGHGGLVEYQDQGGAVAFFSVPSHLFAIFYV